MAVLELKLDMEQIKEYIEQRIEQLIAEGYLYKDDSAEGQTASNQ